MLKLIKNLKNWNKKRIYLNRKEKNLFRIKKLCSLELKLWVKERMMKICFVVIIVRDKIIITIIILLNYKIMRIWKPLIRVIVRINSSNNYMRLPSLSSRIKLKRNLKCRFWNIKLRLRDFRNKLLSMRLRLKDKEKIMLNYLRNVKMRNKKLM